MSNLTVNDLKEKIKKVEEDLQQLRSNGGAIEALDTRVTSFGNNQVSYAHNCEFRNTVYGLYASGGFNTDNCIFENISTSPFGYSVGRVSPNLGGGAMTWQVGNGGSNLVAYYQNNGGGGTVPQNNNLSGAYVIISFSYITS